MAYPVYHNLSQVIISDHNSSPCLPFTSDFLCKNISNFALNLAEHLDFEKLLTETILPFAKVRGLRCIFHNVLWPRDIDQDKSNGNIEFIYFEFISSKLSVCCKPSSD